MKNDDFKCDCTQRDARLCYRIRYHVTPDDPDDGVCDCYCHDEDDEEE